MFLSRRVAQRLCGGDGPAQALMSGAALHPSRTLRLYAKTLTEMVPRNAALLHGKSGAGNDWAAGNAGCGPRGAVDGDWDAGTQRSDAHDALVEGDEPMYQVSVVHADTVANQATAALRSLLGHPRLSSSAVAADADGEDQLTDAGAPATPERVRDSDEVRRGMVGSHLPAERAEPGCGDAVEGDCESNGEEELLENAEAFADEVEMVGREGTAAITAVKEAPLSEETIAQLQNSGGGQRAARSGVMPYSAGEPVNLYGSRYWGDIANALRSAAESRRFLSPFWSSQTAFERVGATVVVKEEEGVLVPTTVSVAVRLFNLEQTTLATEFRAATFVEVIARLRQLRGHETSSLSRGYGGNMQPLNLAGDSLSYQRTCAISDSPHFIRLQTQSPCWLSEHEVHAIGASVRSDEVEFYTLVPLSAFAPLQERRAAASAGAGLSGDARADAANVSALDGEASTDTSRGATRYYNVAQLDDPERFARLNPMRDPLARCFSSRGFRYASTTTWLMWEYCARYHFPLTGTPRIIFLTAETIFRLGGRVVQTKRYPLSCKQTYRVDDTTASSSSSSTAFADVWKAPLSTSAAAPPFEKHRATCHGELDVAPACGRVNTRTCSGFGVRGDADGANSTAADAGIVPPPFTMVMHGEVVSLCNALQTDIADLIFDRVCGLGEHQSRKWCVRF
uniref:Trypanosoma Tc-38 (p38) protein domain-containing protein n=1 Tax=Leishmania guyanensis TaxID=5670 RepID=A0A1E1IUU8_LEIGU|nr:hypothetical protein, conserved [Leishmania guyanensis]